MDATKCATTGQQAGFAVLEEILAAEQKTNGGVFDQCVANPHIAAQSLVRIDYGAHLLFDHADRILPVAILFDYINSGISESEWNLSSVARHLLQRPDVLVLKNRARRWTSVPVLDEEDRRARTAGEAIMRIPSYNSEPGRTNSVEFIWQPTVEDFRRVWNVCNAGKVSYPSTKIHQKVMELDILGLRAAGCTPNTKPPRPNM